MPDGTTGTALGKSKSQPQDTEKAATNGNGNRTNGTGNTAKAASVTTSSETRADLAVHQMAGRPVHPRERKILAFRQERADARDSRALREESLLEKLSEHERLTIKHALEILRKTESTWLVYLFKYSAAKRSRELAAYYEDRERSFEPQGQAWSEIWNEPKKVYITVNKHLPTFFRKWLDAFN